MIQVDKSLFGIKLNLFHNLNFNENNERLKKRFKTKKNLLKYSETIAADPFKVIAFLVICDVVII